MNRKAFPEPEIKLGEVIAPETEMEKKLFAIVSEHLNTEMFGVTTNLISIGLSSLSAMRFVAAIQHHLGEQIKITDVMRQPAICDIVDLIQRTTDCKDAKLQAYEKRDSYPLAEKQHGVYLDWEMHRDTAQYNVCLSCIN